MTGVRPLKQDKHKPHKPKHSKRPHHRVKLAAESSTSVPFISRMYPDCDNQLGASDKISYNAPGIRDKVLRQLRQGKLRIEANCDLHGMNIAVAEEVLAEFLHSCVQSRLKCIRIVHGKSGKHAIIKSWCAQLLRNDPRVLAISSCIPPHGGTGAVYVLLKLR